MKQVLLGFFIVNSLISNAQKLSAEQYIATYAPTAVYEMERSGIPASITLAQGLLESGNGNSPLAATANNHFGIKCHVEWTGDTYYQDDDEKNECFRYYSNAGQSYEDHTDFLMTRSRYAFLFAYPKTDYVSWANGLKQAGYATNPQYPSLLIELIKKYSLHQYDLKNIQDYPDFKKEKVKLEPLVKKEDNKIISKEEKTPVIAQKEVTVNTKAGTFKEEIVVPVEVYYGDAFLVNNIKALIAKKGDTPLSIANKFNVPLNYLYKYNDLFEGEQFKEGNYIYLQPKRNKGYAKYHKVAAGESMYDISQSYGIKLSDLLEKNLMEAGEEAMVGEVVFMRDVNPIKPKSRTYQQLLKEKVALDSKSTSLSVDEKKTNVLSAKSLESSIQDKSIVSQQETSATNDEKKISINNSTPATSDTKVEIRALTEQKIDAVTLIKEPSTLKAATSTPSQEIKDTKTTAIVANHEVKAGDTLYNISKRYGIAIADIIKWNGLVNNTISLGQILRLTAASN